MEGKIIMISNRGVRSNRTGETLFKNKMTKSPHRLRCAKVNPGSRRKKYSLNLVEEGSEQQYLIDEMESANGRPWVFFVHGNNQTLNKNLRKCFELRDLYNVNVLAFSWPSVHHGKIKTLLGYLPSRINVGKYLTRQLKRKLKQYGKARKNAKESAKDLADSLLMFKTALASVNVIANFVCHSLGHRVLKISHEHHALNLTLEPFKNILLHQADEDNENHQQWVNAIGKSENTYITVNERDIILKFSNIYHHKNLYNQRLGNTRKDNEPSPPIYKDFTGEKKLGLSGHTMFLQSEDDNSDIFSYFRSIIAD